MDENKLKELAEKIKNKTATDDEKIEFFRMFNGLLRSMKDDLVKIQKED